ncbi:MAG: ABC transporter ATP-binding protein [Clostridia bacterium]|nr:ABC transporter ATP-binding protein [Clostridia bacterium]
MILRCELGKVIEEKIEKAALGEIVYSLPYDVNEKGMFSENFFVITHKNLISISNDEIKTVLPIEKVEKVKAVELVGAGRLEITCDSICYPVAKYTAEYMPQFAMVERIIQEILDGEARAHESFEESKRCPNCGRNYLRNTRICPQCSDKKGMFKRVAAMAAPCKNLYIIMLVLFWLNSAVMLLAPEVQKRMINDAITNPDGKLSVLIFFVVITAICNILTTAIGIARRIVSVKASNRLVKDMRGEVYSKLQQMGIGKLESKKTGDMMQRINRDTMRIGHFIQNIGVMAVNEIILFLSVAVVLFVYNWRMAILILLPMPFVSIIVNKARHEVRRRYHTQWRKSDKMTSKLNDILNGMRVVKAFGRENWAIEQFAEVATEVKEQSIDNDRFSGTIWPIVRFLVGFGSYFVLLYGGNLVANGALKLGDLMQFSTYASYLYNRLDWFAMLPRHLSEAATSAQRVFEVLDEESDYDTEEKKGCPEIKGDIIFKDVTFGYKSYRSVIKNFSLHVKEGEMIGLVGHSGAGKSTLINLLMRLYDVDDGAITINGNNLKDIDRAYYKHNLGIVLQESYLFAGSILSNICYAKPDATVDDVVRAAKIANAHDFIMRLPNGYDTYVGEKGYRLSGGERQRIAIARAVISDPKILILDEATASVDTETEAQIQEALGRLVKGRTTFAIAHRLSTLKNANRLVVLEEGRIAEVGTHNQLMEKDGIYAGLVKAQRTMNAMNFNADEGGMGGRRRGPGGRGPGGPPR